MLYRLFLRMLFALVALNVLTAASYAASTVTEATEQPMQNYIAVFPDEAALDLGSVSEPKDALNLQSVEIASTSAVESSNNKKPGFFSRMKSRIGRFFTGQSNQVAEQSSGQQSQVQEQIAENQSVAETASAVSTPAVVAETAKVVDIAEVSLEKGSVDDQGTETVSVNHDSSQAEYSEASEPVSGPVLDQQGLNESVFALQPKTAESIESVADQAPQLGFSFGFEDITSQASSDAGFISALSETRSGSIENNTHPDLTLGWAGGTAARYYRLEATRRYNYNDPYVWDSVSRQNDPSWGLRLSSDWKLNGPLKSAGLTLAYGDAFGHDYLVESPAYVPYNFDYMRSVGISPGLRFKLKNDSTFTVAYQRFEDELGASDISDSVHLGLRWSIWPNSEVGLDFIDRNSVSEDGYSDQQIQFGVRKSF